MLDADTGGVGGGGGGSQKTFPLRLHAALFSDSRKTWFACTDCHFVMDGADLETIKKWHGTRLAGNRSSGYVQ